MWFIVSGAFASDTFDFDGEEIVGELQRPAGSLIALGPRLEGRPARGVALEERAFLLRMDLGLDHTDRADRLQHRAVRIYERALDRAGEDAPAVHVRLGLLLLDLDARDDAYLELREALIEAPDGPHADMARIVLADQLFEDAQLTEAIALYQEVRDDDKLGYARFREAWCWFNLGDLDRAVDAMVAVQDTPSDGLLSAEARKDLARFAAQMDNDDALAAIGAACDGDVACIDVLVDRADTLRDEVALPPLEP